VYCSHVLSCPLAILNPRVVHTMDILSPFTSVLCHSDWGVLSTYWRCPPRPCMAFLTCVHLSLFLALSLFFQATPLFPHGVTIVCYLIFPALKVSNNNPSSFQLCYPPAPVAHSERVCCTLCHFSPLPWSCRRWWVGCIYGWLSVGHPLALVVLPPKWPTGWCYQRSDYSPSNL